MHAKAYSLIPTPTPCTEHTVSEFLLGRPCSPLDKTRAFTKGGGY